MPGRFAPPPSRMDRGSFVARFGDVYEHSPWIAAALYDRGLTTAEDASDGLAAALAAIVAKADDAAKLALVRAHPDLAGHAAVAGELTAYSKSEQAGAGLGRCTPEEFARLQALNASYKHKFGFPFIIAVAGLDRQSILAALALRLQNHAETELRTALAEIDRIAYLRLSKMAPHIEPDVPREDAALALSAAPGRAT